MSTTGKRLYWRTITTDWERDACGRQGPWQAAAWILQYFLYIIGWEEVSTYTEVMPLSSRFFPRQGNQHPDPYKRDLDRMVAEDIKYVCYAAHREMVKFGCYLPERVMRQFGFEQTIPRDPTASAPISMTRMQLEEVFADWEQHVVHEEARAMPPDHDWSCVEGYISWYYKVSHPTCFQPESSQAFGGPV
ncbi:uncharacterized protein LOC131619875 [Vicia villosa]|uniref:uncharacterized protein LOC131619875 n=1 Tax=Vicia villosa TaxID=3911 RepID=UPI00273CCD9E|nr:uncharacterized protein LOC131619875 [Vicia villosa]